MTEPASSEIDQLQFTGERLILEPETPWFWEPMALEHVGRYLFAKDRVGGLRVLDAACGTGYGSALLARAAASVTGVDIDVATIGFAAKRWASPTTSFVVGDVGNLPFADRTFDAIVSFETIEHVPDPDRVLDEFSRVLKPAGLLLVSTPSRDVYNWVSFPHGEGNPFHHSEMTPDEFGSRLRRKFRLEGLYGQIHVPTFGGSSESTTGPLPRPLVQFAKWATRRTTSWLLSRRHIAGLAVRRLRPGFLPQPLDDRPWKYVVAVARSVR